MSYEKFSAVKKAYFSIVCPTQSDFKRYTKAYFKWVDAVFKRCDAKYPGLLAKKLPPLPLFEDAKKEVAT